MPNENVLARIHLNAVLSNLEILSEEDPDTASIASGWNGSILFIGGTGGPKSTLEINNSKIKVTSGAIGNPDIVLFFLTQKMLNNMFKGTGVGFPIPLKGLIKAKGLFVFMKLAKRMEEILKGNNPPKELKSKLLLNTLAKSIAAIAGYDPDAKASAATLHGTTELRIKDGYAMHILFGGSFIRANNGKAKDADFIMEFSTDDFFLDLADDKVDVMAAICLQEMSLQGDLHMGDVVNTFLDKVGIYLQ